MRVSALMTLQKLEETAERNHPVRHAQRELVWSQWDDLFLSSREKKGSKAEHRNDLRGTHAVLMDVRKGGVDFQMSVLLYFRANTRVIVVAV